MAATVSSIADVLGNVRGKKAKVTFGANSATADVVTGLSSVDHAIVMPLEGSAMPSMRFNSAVAGTATKGTIALSSGTSAGSYIILSFGPDQGA